VRGLYTLVGVREVNTGCILQRGFPRRPNLFGVMILRGFRGSRTAEFDWASVGDETRRHRLVAATGDRTVVPGAK